MFTHKDECEFRLVVFAIFILWESGACKQLIKGTIWFDKSNLLREVHLFSFFLCILHMSLYPIEVITGVSSLLTDHHWCKTLKKRWKTHTLFDDEKDRWDTIEMEDWRAFFHISSPFDFFFLSLGFVFFCRRSAQNSSVSDDLWQQLC